MKVKKYLNLIFKIYKNSFKNKRKLKKWHFEKDHNKQKNKRQSESNKSVTDKI